MIDLYKKYRYSCGEPARILCINRPGEDSVVSVNSEGSLLYHTPDGKHYLREYDLIENKSSSISTELFKIDDLVMVACYDSDGWKCGHFAGYTRDGEPTIWANGLASWTAQGRRAVWNAARRLTEKELQEYFEAD